VSTLAIVLIAVGVVALLAILYFTVLSSRRREQRRLNAQRTEAAERHREIASQRNEHATVAEQQAAEARLQAERAEREAQLARQEAEVHEGRAGLHEEGRLDHELTAEPDDDTTAIDRPDNLADRNGEPVEDDGRFQRTTQERTTN
jgi:septal ring factor EnvC (AmiA/AmiB activator)